MNTMLKTRNGGSKAPGGLYWHFGNWEIKALDGKEVTLPGSAQERYLRIPTLALHTTDFMAVAKSMYERMGFLRDESFDFVPRSGIYAYGYRLDVSSTPA